jgi:outer membrane protein assembly factor BamB
MIKHNSIRVAVTMAAMIAASGCSILNRGKGPSTPVVGERIAVLSSESGVEVDPAIATQPLNLPPPVTNPEWTQSGGSASKSMGQLALGGAARIFSVQAGRGSSLTARLASAPIVANGRVYTIDTMGSVRAFNASTGAAVWTAQTPSDRGADASLYGGGIAYDNGHVFATNGLGYVVSLSAATGALEWQVRPGGPLRGSPAVSGGALYVISQDNQIFSLNQANGATNWNAAASLEVAGVFGSASPAIGQGTVVAGFSSGELNAYRYENGRQVWQDTLQRTSIRTSVASLSDVDADPVIDNGQVFAVGQGGRMVALDLNSGQRLWELNLAGIDTPWIAGEWIYVITDDAKLICIARSNGHIRWINQLPEFLKAKSKRGEIEYSGPVLAGGRLIVTGSTGALIYVNPATGAYQGQVDLGTGISLPPVVANSTLYILDDRGQLHAYR